jgi:hypothetical protein
LYEVVFNRNPQKMTFNYKPKTKKALWTGTPSGKRSLRSAAAHKQKSADKRKASCSRKLSQQKSIRCETPKHAKADRLYNAQAKKHLFNDGIGRLDMVALALNQGAIKATCIHHARGRLGTLKFDERFWIPTTMQNSLWPHTHISAARRLNLIAQTGEWHVAPDDDETKRIRDWMDKNSLSKKWVENLPL